jgi:hypothetical protein
MGLKQIAIIGKIVRGSHDRGHGKAALHPISARAVENHLASLSQMTALWGLGFDSSG